ncbi:uncharacterized protein LOC142320744 [Lycorma delicatula]|uniref:uncharacterized protein LOC142320744 n=1 Tax=Lycorma delicatula TaxID=130591 RepID=UPI003F51225C
MSSPEQTLQKKEEKDGFKNANLNSKKKNAPYNNFIDDRFGGDFSAEQDTPKLDEHKEVIKTGSLWHENFFYKISDPRFKVKQHIIYTCKKILMSLQFVLMEVFLLYEKDHMTSNLSIVKQMHQNLTKFSQAWPVMVLYNTWNLLVHIIFEIPPEKEIHRLSDSINFLKSSDCQAYLPETA